MNIDEFDSLIQSAHRPLMVEFWAPWCVPCRVIGPILAKLQEKYAGQVDLVRIDADQSPELIRRLGIRGIPTLIGYRQGEMIFRKTGSQPAAAIDRLFAGLTGAAELTAGPSGLDRLLRAGAGLALIALGFSLDGYNWLILLGGLLAFSAVYDRCPVYRALAPRVKNILRSMFFPQNKSV